ncbi:hypothetical protein JXB02_00060 [Candidatus Woesearchaeota archaeon]|nr:hypothetical protein [Candidatus Woesearchaeota archaeon]
MEREKRMGDGKERQPQVRTGPSRPIGIMFVALACALLLAPSAIAIVKKGELENIYLVRPVSKYIDAGYVPPEYISIEDLTFYTCLEEEDIPIKSTIICIDDNSFDDLDVIRWENESCFIASYDLADKECQNIIIRSEYTRDDEDFTLDQRIRVNRLSSVINKIEETQYSDGGWKDSINTVHGVWALSRYAEIYDDELEAAIDWLKEYRDNEDKCWPKDVCEPRTTAHISAFLTLSGYNVTKRVVRDSEIWLEKFQNFYTDESEWTINATALDINGTPCLFSYYNRSRTNPSPLNLSIANSSTVLNITPAYGMELVLECSANVRVIITTEEDEEVTLYEGDNLTYPIPGPCWSNGQRWEECDVRTTLYALMSNISSERKDVAMAWVNNQRHNDGNRGSYVGVNASLIDAALYIYVNGSGNLTDEVTDWFLYKQNNNGSWGQSNASEQIEPTGYGVLALLKIGVNRTNEIIEDAEEWVSENELGNVWNDTDIRWNSTEKDSFALIILKNNNRPLLKTDPRIIMLEEEDLEVEVYNPTTFDLDDLGYELSDGLEPLVEIEPRPKISAYSYIKLKMRQTTEEAANTYGHLTITNRGEEIARVPVMVVKFPTINITAQKSAQVFGTKGSVSFGVAKTSDTFACDLVWDDDDISSQTRFTVAGQNSIPVDIKFAEAQRLEKYYKGYFDCETRGIGFVLPFSINIDRYPTTPIDVNPKLIEVNASGQNAWFIVTNRLDETVEATVRFTKAEDWFDLESAQLVLSPAEKRNITIFNFVTDDMNLSSANGIEVTALDQKASLTFRVDITAKPSRRMSPTLFWIIIGILIVALGAGGYFGFVYRKDLVALFKPGERKEDLVKLRLKKEEEKGTIMAIQNMSKLLRFQGKKEEEIRRRLLDEGFKDEDIEKVFKQGG